MRVYIVICLLFFCKIGSSYGQNINILEDKFWDAVKTKDYETQVKYGPQLIQYYEQNSFRVDTNYIDFLFRVGTAYYSLNQFENSRNIHLKGIDLARNLLGYDDFRTRMLYYALASDFFKLENNHELIKYSKICLKLFDESLGLKNDYSILMLTYITSSYEKEQKLDSAEYFSKDLSNRSFLIGGKKSETYLYSIFDQARILQKQGKFFEAIELYKESLTISSDLFSNEHFTYVSSLFCLGEIYLDLGNSYVALDYLNECLKIREIIEDKNGMIYGTTLYTLASCYHAIGEYDKSLNLNQASLEIRQRILGDNHEMTLSVLSNMALNYSMLGDHIKSKNINSKILHIKELNSSINSYSYIQSLSNLAVDYESLQMFDSALFCSLEALALLEKNDFQKTQLYGIVTQNLAYSKLTTGELQIAEEYIKISLETYMSLLGENSVKYIESLMILEEILERKGQFEEAFLYLGINHEFCIKNFGFESYQYANSLWNYAQYYNGIGKFLNAVDSIQKALPIYIATYGITHHLTLKLKSNLALYMNNLGRLKEGLSINEEVLFQREKLLGVNHRDYITSALNVAENYSMLSDYENSKYYSLKVLSILKDKNEDLPYLYSDALNNYGVLLKKMQISDSAYFYLNKSLNFTRQFIGPKSEEFLVRLNNLGTLYLETSNIALAKVYFDSAYILSCEIFGSDYFTSISINQNRAASLGDLGNYAEAAAIQLTCLSILEKKTGRTTLDYASGLSQLAYYYSKMDLDSMALFYNIRALEIRKNLLGKEHPLTVLSTFNLAQDYSNLGKYDNAIDLLKLALKSKSKNSENYFTSVKLINQNLGMIYFDKGDYIKSLEFLNNSYEKGDEYDDVEAVLINLSFVHEKLKNIDSAIFYMNLAVDWYLTDYYRNAPYFSEIEKSQYKSKLDYYTKYQIYLSSKNNFKYSINQWYTNYLSSRNLIGINQNFHGNGVTQSEELQLKSLIIKLKYLKTQRNSLIENDIVYDLPSLNNEIDKLERQFFAIWDKYQVKNISVDLITSKVVSDQSIFVDIIKYSSNVNDYSSYLAVLIDKTGEKIISIDTVGHLDQGIYEMYKLNCSDLKNKTDLKDSIFYNSFWKPIADRIGDAKIIYVSLGGVYNNINLNTIYNPETGKYLLEEYDIRIVNSAREFLLNKESVKREYSTNTACLFGFPNFDGNSSISSGTDEAFTFDRNLSTYWIDNLTRGGIKVNSLPETKVEVQNISKTMTSKNWNVTSYLDDSADEANLKNLKSPRVLHIATHGYFFPDIPYSTENNRFLGMNREQVIQDPMLRSGLLFTGANNTLKGESSKGENGLLSAAEASLLDLRETELVVLSACETGRGEETNSEGVYGLRKAFADAGAQNIIMSLWKVDDKVTQEFMSRFYEIWLIDKTTIRDAFNRTQLEIKSKYPEPYYWGAFILIGL
jgi:CHAT domain-containing protein